MDRDVVYEQLSAVCASKEKLYSTLRSLPLDVVGDVLLHIPDEYFELKCALPTMASELVQTNWTGSSGYTLLLQSSAFVRSVSSSYVALTGKTLENGNILDFGCGWGRLIRLMYKFSPPERIYGCDPWDKSIATCLENKVAGNLALSDYLPEELPFPSVNFDFIYSFSVFTHLSERACNKALEACRKAISSDGIMAITVRPKSYWDYHVDTIDKIDRDKMKFDHEAIGFAHTGHHHRVMEDGDILYGDTSISIDYISRNWHDWEVVGTDVFLQDPFQTVVFLKPRL
ncbi:class I SAM-dependent methyltransferase [Pseudomonas sp. B21-054]|uniref:class I SAM-dependent methyltransferase n=1 Tax=Pseudomonas sp. B21-054 TaxID=2895494 RepID=UPI00222E897F|nr:class I SAM-dependent methyltransferase [Pseudomonas sp. B21-054]UZE19673.1 class I SAM-dependent methyltransferase [Pseudomonas sp. B21-054]